MSRDGDISPKTKGNKKTDNNAGLNTGVVVESEKTSPLSEEVVLTLRQALLGWYHASKRDLPFRLTKDPYSIWLSEIMAQQTRITALLPYFNAFVARFPTVESLAEADESEVLKLWEGLGYYSRARNLHTAAKVVCGKYGGHLPADRDALLSLPGIGAYTAGAILSIAFGQKAAAVDGNVIRVHARLTRSEHEVGSPAALALASELCLALMPDSAPGDMTQALMELGALICLPKAPRCGECPVAEQCRARADRVEPEYPRKVPKKEKRVEQRPVWLILDSQNRILMRKRTERLLHGLWEFPAAPPDGLTVTKSNPCGHTAHVFTHIRWEMTGTLARVADAPAPEDFVWISEPLTSLAIPTAFQFYAELAEQARGKSELS